MCLYMCLCSSVCYYRSFSCTLYNLQISRPSSYNAKLHNCSSNTFNKGFPFSPLHHATWWYGICSLNVRGLSNNTEGRETFLWLKKKSSLFTFCKRCIAQKRQNLIGILNGDIRLFLQPSQALRQALLYCSTTIFNFKFWNILPTPKWGLLLQT